jgi:hypothetical protein
MKIQPVRSGKMEFLSVYRRTFEEATTLHKKDLSRLYNLRCSQLPFCPRSVLADFGIKGKYQSMDMSMAYYTSVGTTVHTVMQTYLAMSGRFLADYECRICKKKYPLSHVHECCGTPTHYEEVSIDVGTKTLKNGLRVKGIQGHIDGIFKDSKGKYWIVDFKTTTLFGAPGKERSPGEGYTRQIRAYAVLLKKQYGIRVRGVMLVFIPRDNPRPEKLAVWEQVLSDKDFEIGKEELKADRKLHRKTMVAQTVEEVMELAKTKCGSPYCDYCKMGKSAFKQIAKRIVKKLPILAD